MTDITEAVARALYAVPTDSNCSTMMDVCRQLARAAIAAYEREKAKEREAALAEMARIAREFNLP